MLWIRRRLSRGDEGMSLVEMLIALFVLSVGMLALLGSFLTSAKSLQSQELRSAASRAALERHEHYRSIPFAALGDEEGEVSTADGTTFDYVTDVTEEEVLDPDGEARLVKRVVTTVTWTHHGVERSETFTTTIREDATVVGLPTPPSGSPSPTAAPTAAPTGSGSPAPAQAIVSLGLSPEPTVMGYDGIATDDVLATVVLSGYASSELVTLRWTNGDGTNDSVTLISSDGSTWSKVISRSRVRKNLSAGASGTIPFTATTTAGQTSTKDLQVRGPVADPPTISSFTVSPGAPIAVDNKTGAPTSALTFTCTVAGLDPSAGTHTVRMVYLDRTGVQKELAMSANADNTRWSLVVAAGGQVTFQKGNLQPFTCNATRQPDFGPASLTVEWRVK